MVNGTKLPAGEYKVQWEGNRPQRRIEHHAGQKGDRESSRADRETSKHHRPATRAVVKNNGDGSKSLSEVRLSGKKFAIAVGEEAAKAEATR